MDNARGKLIKAMGLLLRVANEDWSQQFVGVIVDRALGQDLEVYVKKDVAQLEATIWERSEVGHVERPCAPTLEILTELAVAQDVIARLRELVLFSSQWKASRARMAKVLALGETMNRLRPDFIPCRKAGEPETT